MFLPSLGTDNQDLPTEEILTVCFGGFGFEILGGGVVAFACFFFVGFFFFFALPQ